MAASWNNLGTANFMLAHYGQAADACLTLLEETVAKDDYYRFLIEIDPDLKQLLALVRVELH